VIPGLFVGFATILIVSALMVVLHRNPVTSALFLVVAFCALSGIYILMRAEFIGMVQIIVYAGAIMVLFLFVIMYLNLGRDPKRGATLVLRRLIGWGTGGAVLALLGMFLARHWALGPPSSEPVPEGIGNTQALGQLLFSRYLFPFEITSLILLVAMVGAIVISKGRGEPAPPGDTRRGEERATRAAGGMLRPGDVLTPPGGSAS
jgi:NADH-quinone oxidoreductase subunit J